MLSSINILKFMRKLSAIFALIFIVLHLQAESLALIFDSAESPFARAALNGANDALKELSLRYKTPLSIANLTPQNALLTAETQALALDKAKLSGARGAIVFPINDGNNILSSKIEKLSDSVFYTSLISVDLSKSSRLCAILKDEEKFLDNFENVVLKKSKSEIFELLIILKGDTEAKISEEEAAQLLPQNIKISEIKVIGKKVKIVYYKCRFFSMLQEKFRKELKDLDAYGIIFAEDSVLQNMSKIEDDLDRAFVLCMGISPYMSEYLESGKVELCSYDDFYGYGYLSAVKLVEKIFENKNPNKEVEYIAPLKYNKKDLKRFHGDWIKFLR